MTAPVPTGVGFSRANIAVNIATDTFTMGAGFAVVTFQPRDVNDPGVATLYDSSDNVVVTLSSEGYENLIVPVNGASYYFKATKGANILAATQPTVWR